MPGGPGPSGHFVEWSAHAGEILPVARSGAVLTGLWTATALAAFAANSLLCRQALSRSLMDPASFTLVRVLAGAAVLAPLALFARRAAEQRPAAQGQSLGAHRDTGGWISAFALVTYAAAFSWAYTTLTAGTGSLIAFAAVQATMIGTAVARGERLGPRGWSGAAIAMTGLVVLVFPGLRAPDPGGAVAMTIAGAAWGVYSLRGRSAGPPLRATAAAFARGSAIVITGTALLAALRGGRWRVTAPGVALALASGAVTSGLGYAVWYRALRDLSAAAAALVQLAVPVIASIAGALLLSEPLTARLVAASATVLGGLALALAPRGKTRIAAGGTRETMRERPSS